MREALKRACKTLHLAYVMDSYEAIGFEDKEQFLLHVLQAEIQHREENRLKRLLRKAAFTQLKTLQDYDFSAMSCSGFRSCKSLGLGYVRSVASERAEKTFFVLKTTVYSGK